MTKRNKHKNAWKFWTAVLVAMCIPLILAHFYGLWRVDASELIDPSPYKTVQLPTPTPGKAKDLPKEYSDYQVDAWVTYYSRKFSKSNSENNHTRQLLHCLLYREAGYGSNKNHGDNGKAGGPLQYHQPTWDAYRKIMMKKGLIEDIGSRYDMEQAIETTAWAINDGRSTAWGPFLRGECK